MSAGQQEPAFCLLLSHVSLGPPGVSVHVDGHLGRSPFGWVQVTQYDRPYTCLYLQVCLCSSWGDPWEPDHRSCQLGFHSNHGGSRPLSSGQAPTLPVLQHPQGSGLMQTFQLHVPCGCCWRRCFHVLLPLACV